MTSDSKGENVVEASHVFVRPSPPRPRRLTRKRVLAALFVLLVIVIAVGIGASWSLRDALTEARAGRDAVGDFRSGFDIVDNLDDTRADLEVAEGHFARSVRHLNSPWLSVAGLAPFVGTQIDSADSLAAGGHQATLLAIAAIDEAEALIDGGTDDRLAVVRELGAIARRARSGLNLIDLGPENGILERLRDVRTTLADQLQIADDDLTVVQEIADGLEDVLNGPTSYLLLVANNAEMRGGSGSFLAAGIVTIRDADIEVTNLASVHEYVFDLDQVVDADPTSSLWIDIEHTTDWQLLGSSPRFDWTAPLALKMWEEANGDQLDGVVAVDAVVLEALLEVTGPVDVGGRTFTADQVLFEILFNQYFSVTVDNYRDYNETQIQRRDRLGALAKEALGALEEREIDTQLLVEQLRGVISGRHLMVWTPDDSSLWDALGVSGELTDQSLALSLINAGGNKLDFWTEMFAEVVIVEDTAGVTVEISVRVVVEPPDDAPRYVVGPHPGIGENPGDYLGVMAFNVPAAATEIRVVSGQVRSRGPDGPTEAVLVDVELAAGGSTDIVMSFRLPDGHPPLVVEPSARVPATRWLYGEQRWRSGAAVEIPLVPAAVDNG